MNDCLHNLLTQFQIELELQTLPETIGGYYTYGFGLKRLVVNKDLPFAERLNVCFELIFKHCLDEHESTFILYDMSQSEPICIPSAQFEYYQEKVYV